jgi:S-DNA-T family DNA segregation ATPase FtsK/SpoIIIE
MLVAGATGSGKSEFLRTLMLGCAARASPAQLVIVGIDHKGGATFADLDALPHLAAVVTDLDTAASARAITALGAELRARERLLEAHGVAKPEQLDPAIRPPALLVVVDEFRTLLETQADAMGSLERLAAQGRSLGMHLILATQRPAGAVSAQLRANLALRVCFRVVGQMDSVDVLSADDAANLDPSLPGSAYAIAGGGPPRLFRAFLPTPWSPQRARTACWPDNWHEPPGETEPVRAVISAIKAATTQLGLPDRAAAPWQPPLPEQVTLDQLPRWPVPGAGEPPQTRGADASWSIGVCDLPHEQRQELLVVGPQGGNLLVVGASRSGRSTAGACVAAAALRGGAAVHVVSANPRTFGLLQDAPGMGTLTSPSDPRVVARLFEILTTPTQDQAHAPVVLVVDDADAVNELMLPGIDGPPLDMLTAARTPVAPWIVACSSTRPGRWSTRFPQRLILPTADRGEDLALGVSTDLAAARANPGRAVYLRPGVEFLTQVATPTLTTPASAQGPPVNTPERAAPRPPRLLPLPQAVTAAELPTPTRDALWWGRGGDEAEPVPVRPRPGRPLAVIGPPGSGRSNALRLLAAQAAAAGWPTHTLDGASATTWEDITTALERDQFVLVDDLDRVHGQAPPALPQRGILVGGLTTAAAASFRGPGPLFAASAAGLILAPTTPGSSQALGMNIDAQADPTGATRPGCAVALDGWNRVPVQVALATTTKH